MPLCLLVFRYHEANFKNTFVMSVLFLNVKKKNRNIFSTLIIALLGQQVH